MLEMKIPAPPNSPHQPVEVPREMNTTLVSREDRGPVTVLTMNRPGQRNALSRAGGRSYVTPSIELSVDENVRAIVLTGAGAAFCAGMDLKEAAASTHRPRRRTDHRHASRVCRPAPAVAHVAEADDRGRQWRCSRRWCRLDVGLRRRDRRRESPDRLSGGSARAGRGDRHARPDPPDRRPPSQGIALERRPDLQRGRARMGSGEYGHSERSLPARGDPDRRGVWPNALHLRWRPPRGCSMRRPARTPRLGRRRHQRGGSLLGRGEGRHPRASRKAPAGLGAVQTRGESSMT